MEKAPAGGAAHPVGLGLERAGATTALPSSEEQRDARAAVPLCDPFVVRRDHERAAAHSAQVRGDLLDLDDRVASRAAPPLSW